MGDVEREIVIIDQELEDIVPGYLKNRQKDLALLPQALEAKDFSTILTLGHRMKGSGSGYGFNEITDIGKNMEEAAKGSDVERVASLITELTDYLNRIDIVFEEL